MTAQDFRDRLAAILVDADSAPDVLLRLAGLYRRAGEGAAADLLADYLVRVADDIGFAPSARLNRALELVAAGHGTVRVAQSIRAAVHEQIDNAMRAAVRGRG